MKRGSAWHLAGLLIAVLLGLRVVTYLLADKLLDAMLMGLGATTILVLVRRARRIDKIQASFTQDQLLMMRELIAKERRSIEEKRQEIISEGAREGRTVSTERVLDRVENLKSTYDGPDREQFIQEIDRFILEFREKHGPEIPVDEAYRLMKEIEQKHPI